MTSQAITEALLWIFTRTVHTHGSFDKLWTKLYLILHGIYNLLGIQHLKMAPCCSQSEGLLEWFHHTFLQMVQKRVESQTDRDLYLPLFLSPVKKPHCLRPDSSHLSYSSTHTPMNLDVVRQQ